MKVNIRELLAFYDEDSMARTHANAIKTFVGEELGLALLIEYFRRSNVEARLLDHSCKASNDWLDGWVEAKFNSGTVHYQVEVKSWSYHSKGGRRLPLNCTPQQLSDYKRRTWLDYWDGTQFRAPALRKVMTPMKRPPNVSHVEPLASLWPAMHPSGLTDVLFSVPVSGPDFERLWVFSASAFLRTLPEKVVDLDLPIASERIRWLQRILSDVIGTQ